MKVRFNGMFVKKSKGCGCSGRKTSTSKSFMIHKTFILPSGRTMSFSIDQEYEVSDLDGNFLLSYTQIDKDGLMQSAFTRVD